MNPLPITPDDFAVPAPGPARPWARRLLELSGLTSSGGLDAHAYREHLGLQNRLRIVWLMLVAGAFYPGFSVLDAVVFPTRWGAFLSIRLAVTAAIFAYALACWRRPRGRMATAAVLFGCGACQVGILTMIFMTGGFASSYWVGLLIVFAGYVGFTPHGAGVAAAFFAAVELAYFAGSWWLVGPPRASATAIEEMFFLGAGGALLALVTAFNELNRRQVFAAKLRIAEQRVELERARAERDEAVVRSRAGRLSGRTLAGRYELGEVLGRGGAGEVYRARDRETDAACAVKVLHPELTDSEESIRRFLREAEHAARVASEHVVSVLATGHDAGCGHFLVMEYVVGEDLGALFHRRGGIAFAELQPIVAQIADVLEATHAAGVIHRDLKPKNVLITTRTGAPFVKLIDFGISKVLAPQPETTLTAPVAILGSVGYMAPEQALGLSSSVGPATDVFALGAITYRGLTGRLAFPGENLMNFCLRVCFQPFSPVEELVPGLHPDVTLALALGLAKDPADRLTSPAALVALLGQAAVGALDPGTRKRALSLYRPEVAGSTAGDATLNAR